MADKPYRTARWAKRPCWAQPKRPKVPFPCVSTPNASQSPLNAMAFSLIRNW